MESDIDHRIANMEREIGELGREMKVGLDRMSHALGEIERRFERLSDAKGGGDREELLFRDELREQMKGIRDDMRELREALVMTNESRHVGGALV